jgi:hypothetical protein
MFGAKVSLLLPPPILRLPSALVFLADFHVLFPSCPGEQTISPFDLHLDPSNSDPKKRATFTRLPLCSGALQNGVAFLPKRIVDVRKVELLKGYRLTAKTIEEVSFKIPVRCLSCCWSRLVVQDQDTDICSHICLISSFF